MFSSDSQGGDWVWVGNGEYFYYDNWDFGEPSNSIIWPVREESVDSEEYTTYYPTYPTSDYPFETTPYPTPIPTTTYGPRYENCLAMEANSRRRWNDIDCFATDPEELKRPICQIFE